LQPRQSAALEHEQVAAPAQFHVLDPSRLGLAANEIKALGPLLGNAADVDTAVGRASLRKASFSRPAKQQDGNADAERGSVNCVRGSPCDLRHEPASRIHRNVSGKSAHNNRPIPLMRNAILPLLIDAASLWPRCASQSA